MKSPSNTGGLGPTAKSLPIALLRARETVMEPVREMLARSDISEQKWRVLRVLAEAGPLEQTAIATQACLLLPSLTRILRSMEKDGLVDRQAGEIDRRKSIVSITGAGLNLIETHAKESKKLFKNLEELYGKKDLKTLIELLDKLQRTPL